MDNTNIFKNKMTDIANAIRETGKTSNLLTIDEMSAKIKLIPSDGGYYTMDDFGQFIASGNFPENSELFIDGTIYLKDTVYDDINLPFTFGNLTIKEISYYPYGIFPLYNYSMIINGAQGNTIKVNKILLGKQSNYILAGVAKQYLNINFHKIYLPYIEYNYIEDCNLTIGMGDSHIIDIGERYLYFRELSHFDIFVSNNFKNEKRAIVFRKFNTFNFSAFNIVSPTTIPNNSLDKTYIFVPNNYITSISNSPAVLKLKNKSTQLLPLSEYREEDF